MSPSLTRRGWGAILAMVVLTALAARFGARSLNAVVMPMALAVIAAYVAAWRVSEPEVRRRPPEDAFVGESRPVHLEFDLDAPVTGRVHDQVSAGLAADGNHVETTIGARPFEYEVTYAERGPHTLGGTTVTVRDVLGLAARRFEYGIVDEVVAYPKVYELAGASRTELAMLHGAGLDSEREEFDSLREYQSGDSLRDVHWKTSAKQPEFDLVVKEFVAEDEVSDVVIAAEAAVGLADEMASATASLAVHLLDRGIGVGVVAPAGSVDPGMGSDHRADLLDLLARTGPGSPDADARREADVLVEAAPEAVRVEFEGIETTFSSLAGLDWADGADGTGGVERDWGAAITGARQDRAAREEVVQ